MSRLSQDRQHRQMVKLRIKRGWTREMAETLPRSPLLFVNDKAVDWPGIFNKVWAELNQNG